MQVSRSRWGDCVLLSPPSPSNPHGDGDTEVPEEISPQRHGGWEPAYHVLRLRHGCRLAEQEPTARWERRGSHRRGAEDCSSGWSAGTLGPGVSRGHRSPKPALGRGWLEGSLGQAVPVPAPLYPQRRPASPCPHAGEQPRVRAWPDLGARSTTPPRERPGEGAGSPTGGLGAQSQGPACWCVLSPLKKKKWSSADL